MVLGILTNGAGQIVLQGASIATSAQTAAVASILQSFNQTNTDGSGTSPGLVRMPLHFADGDVSASQIPKVEIQGGAEITNIQFSQRRNWNSGALKRCVCSFRDSTFSSSEARTYDVSAQTGSYDDTPAFVIGDITTEADLRVDFTNVLFADESASNQPATFTTTISSATVTVDYTAHGRSVGDSFLKRDTGTTTVGSLQMRDRLFVIATADTNSFTFTHPDGTASSNDNDTASDEWIWFPAAGNDHEAVFSDGVTTNIDLTAYEAGPIACSWTLTQKAKDSVTTILDANLAVRWYITAWNDGSDTINGNLEFFAKPMIEWYDVAGRAEMNYTATLKDDVTSIQEYADVPHLANGGWPTVRMDDDPEHGKRHWLVGSQIPTLVALHDADYMERAFIVPPYPLIGLSIPAESSQTYIPMHNLGYRADTNSSGSYTGRGPMNPQDVTCLLKGDAVSWRTARTDAFHAMHYPVHYREAASDTLMSLNMIQPGSVPGDYDFTGDGLETSRDAYWGNTPGTDGHVVAITSLGKWDVSRGRDGYNDSTHQMDPSFGMWLLTGERYYLDASMGMMMKSMQQDGGPNNQIINANTASRASAWSMDTSFWNALIWTKRATNHRYIGWSSLALGHVAGTIPDDDKHLNYVKKLNEQNGDMLTAAIAVLPTAWTDVGHFISINNDSDNGPRYFFDLMNAVSFRYNAMLTEDPGFAAAADLYAVYVKNKFNMNHSAWASYNSGERIDLEELDPAISTPFSPTDMFANILSASITSDIVSCDAPGTHVWTTDDKVIFLTTNGEKATRTIAPEAPKGVVKHVINPTAGTSYQLSDTQGGAAINFASDHTGMSVQVQWQDEKVSATEIDGDAYAGMASMILRWAHNLGDTIVDGTLSTEIELYCTNENYTSGGNDLHYAARDLT